MARQESLSILLDGSGKELLAETYSKVIENVQKTAVSTKMKNMDLSGDPEAGSVEAKRFANAKSKDYGTARAAGAGDKVKAKPVTVKIDTDREIVEELEEKDTTLYGVDGLVERRSRNHSMVMVSELDTAFFSKAVEDGISMTVEGNTVPDIIESALVQCESTKNEYVDGVPREMMNLVCSPAWYSKIRNYLDTVSRPNLDSTQNDFLAFHGVETDSSVHLPAGVDFLVMVNGSVAQPVLPRPYDAEKIPLSEAYAVELFYYYGTESVMPDLIFVKKTA